MADREVIDFLNSNLQLLKKNDFDKIFSIANMGLKGKIFDFVHTELGLNPLKYMSEIPDNLFYTSQLKGIIIPDSIKRINTNAFCNDTIENIQVDSPSVQLSAGAFMDCDALKSIKFTEGLNKIPSRCFEDCRNLQLVELPNSLVSIGADAFNRASADTVVIVPYKTENRLRVPRGEIAWYKEHLKHRHSSQENAKLNVNADEANSAVED